MARRMTGLCLMGWILTASGAIAGPPDLVRALAPRCAQSQQQRMDRVEVADPETGADLRLTSRGNGAVQASLRWQDLELRKVSQPNGDFNVRLAGRHDLVILVRTGDRLRVSRNGQSAVFLLNQVDEDGLDQVQQVLAGSRAMRQFRLLRGRLAEDSLASAPGVSIDLVDAMLGILQGDQSVLDRRRTGDSARLSWASFRAGPTCYGEWEAEVVAAWEDFARCIDDVKWYPGMQELCGISWLLRVESAWFRFIACSSFPLKTD
jgi:hypothetical protein